MCVASMYASVYICIVCLQCLLRPEEGVESFGLGVNRQLRAAMWMLVIEPGSSARVLALLTEQSPQPQDASYPTMKKPGIARSLVKCGTVTGLQICFLKC